MSVNKRFSLGELKKAAQQDIEQVLAEVQAAVDNAPEGDIIAGSEEAVREALARFRQRLYEKAVQLKADAGASAFSPSGRRIGCRSGLAAQGPADGRSPDR
jgi:sugar/nucleoside kinase (ribokinase family)